jgi:phosphoglycerate dehydrogenase-like enzyme
MSVNVLVLANPAARYLKVLDELPDSANLKVGADPAYLAEAAPEADVIFNAVFGGELLRQAFPLARRVRWVHNISAGVESALFPELIESSVPLTNGRGVFGRILGEWAVAAMLFYAKSLRRLVKQQEEGVWEQFDIEELHGKTLGIIGYGEIGRSAAERAKPFGMRITAIRRRPALSGSDPLLDRIYPADRLPDLLREADYVLIAAPNTPETRGMIGPPELAIMKPTAVLINVGRGPLIEEAALIDTLQHGRIRGAALDVFDEEPLPAGHPFYGLKNVLLSPHSADHFSGWIESAARMFVRNFHHFVKGEPLENVVDKRAGY